MRPLTNVEPETFRPSFAGSGFASAAVMALRICWTPSSVLPVSGHPLLCWHLAT